MRLDNFVRPLVRARYQIACSVLALGMGVSSPALSQQADTLRILINQSPWLNAFIAMVDRYEDETGVRMELDVTPFAGMLEKTRNSLRADSGQYDIVNLNSAGMAEIYAGGFLTPLTEIDPEFALPEGVLGFGGSAYWGEDTDSFDPEGGDLLGVPTNGNVQVLYYRKDLYEELGLEVPDTWEELMANSLALHNPPERYGFVPRAARDSILYNFTPYLFSHGATFFADAAGGDYSIAFNSEEGLAALETYIALGAEAGPPNPGSIAQAELIQMMATGRGAQAIAVVAAVADLNNPDSSAVAGQIGTALIPAGPDGLRSSAAGHWMAAIPRNVPEANQQAALDFLAWFIEREMQIYYVQSGGVPIRDDLTGSELDEDPAFEFIEAFSANAKNAQMNMPLVEGTLLKDIISLHLNLAVIGDVSPREALNAAAAEAHQALVDAGYDVTPPGEL
ncbi:carbohydrate ABC transporter substrate-binding protein, CUT1 family [Pelagibacterium halotolerans]|nr:extracellular solute-binding protein [Pelagibacterium halotolerans]SEA67465.1 carbohydrate ABC transporter substrate-binding protein, CUT1 family [Pelagibacterium halotolerans]